MANFNSVMLIGRLTADPEVRMTADGTAICNFRLAVNEKFKRRDGEAGESTCFIQVEAWRALADICGKYLTKGREVFVLGKLRYSEWKTDEGQKRSKISVTARSIQFMGGRRGNNGQGAGADVSLEPEPVGEETEEAAGGGQRAAGGGRRGANGASADASVDLEPEAAGDGSEEAERAAEV